MVLLDTTKKEVIQHFFVLVIAISLYTALATWFGLYNITTIVFISLLISGLSYPLIKQNNIEKRKCLVDYDTLTGLPTRPKFDNIVQEKLSTNNAPIALLVINIDHFRHINDGLGYTSGDNLLNIVATRIQSVLPPNSTLARLGGDTFGVCFCQLDSEVEAIIVMEMLADKILEAIHTPIIYGDRVIYLSVSIGITVSSLLIDTFDGLVNQATLAMYQAKESGRNGFVTYQTYIGQPQLTRLDVEHGLYHALENNELELYYQPQFDTTTQQLIGAECLIRWNHPTWGLLSPESFIRMAEDTILINKINEYAMSNACIQCKAWHDAGKPNLTISVNLSAKQFRADQLIDQVNDCLMLSGLRSTSLELEITETIAMYDCKKVNTLLQTLQEMGISIAIDDFGTGYSSLSYLRTLPITTIKIDKSFISDIGIDESGAILVSAIIQLAKGLKLKTIAEGVETTHQLQTLIDLGCDSIQGYLLGKPMQSSEFFDKYIKNV